MATEFITSTVKKKVEENLFNHATNLLNEKTKKFEFEQYKMLVESTYKLEERRNGSNNMFIAINSILTTVLTQIIPYPEVNFEKLIPLAFLLPIGMIICWDWLRTIETYKKLNYINHSFIKALENSLPTSIFSLRTEILDEPNIPSKVNALLKKETLLPIIFICGYLAYFIIIVSVLVLISNWNIDNKRSNIHFNSDVFKMTESSKN